MRLKKKNNHRIKDVLMIINESAKSIKKISKESNIPIVSTYRIIRKLEKHGIVLREGKIDNGVRWNLYKYNPIIGKNFKKIEIKEPILIFN